jgi:hypothetical protein
MTNPLISEIVSKVRADGVIKKDGLLQFELAGISIEIDNKDIVGGVLQSWFGEWLKVHGYEYLNSATQTFPDFEFNRDIYLELKTFNAENGPAFDIANFASYLDSLLTKPQRLNSDYLIFSYKVHDSRISINDIWVKKVWEITGPSPTNITELQVKRDRVYNIRPKTWYSPRVETYASRRDFVNALWRAGMRFGTPDSCNSQWFNNVEKKFKEKTGTEL